MQWLDRISENSARALAQRTSRRSLLGGLGAVLLGATTFPLLPVARAQETAPKPKPADKNKNRPGDDAASPAEDPGSPSECEYWRHCAIGGFLCSCCGGSQTTCPPGTEMSAVTWIGTCRNPADGKDYAIWYNDCCGRGFCGRCFCNRNEGDRPVYHPYRSNDINWCGGASSQMYHCSTALVIGLAEE